MTFNVKETIEQAEMFYQEFSKIAKGDSISAKENYLLDNQSGIQNVLKILQSISMDNPNVQEQCPDSALATVSKANDLTTMFFDLINEVKKEAAINKDVTEASPVIKDVKSEDGKAEVEKFVNNVKNAMSEPKNTKLGFPVQYVLNTNKGAFFIEKNRTDKELSEDILSIVHGEGVTECKLYEITSFVEKKFSLKVEIE